MKRLRTLQIGLAASAGAGGLSRYYFSLLPALAECGVASSGFVSGERSDRLIDDVFTIGATSAALPIRWLNMRRLSPPMIRKCDVAVSHFAAYAFPVLDHLRRKPFVVHFHGPWALESQAEGQSSLAVAVKRAIEVPVYRAARRVIVLSEAFADIATRRYGVAPDVVRIIPGGVDAARFARPADRRASRERLGWPLDRPTVVTVRRLVAAKGIENLIRATAIVRRRIPNVFVAIAGDGVLAGELERAITEAGLTDCVKLVGRVPEDALPDVYHAADLCIVPTVTLEGFGLTVVEALAAGTPVLVTPVGGLPEVVSSLDPGLILDGYLPEQLAVGIADALCGKRSLPSPEECVAYASRFRWNEIARRVAGVYAEAV